MDLAGVGCAGGSRCISLDDYVKEPSVRPNLAPQVMDLLGEGRLFLAVAMLEVRPDVDGFARNDVRCVSRPFFGGELHEVIALEHVLCGKAPGVYLCRCGRQVKGSLGYLLIR